MSSSTVTPGYLRSMGAGILRRTIWPLWVASPLSRLCLIIVLFTLKCYPLGYVPCFRYVEPIVAVLGNCLLVVIALLSLLIDWFAKGRKGQTHILFICLVFLSLFLILTTLFLIVISFLFPMLSAGCGLDGLVSSVSLTVARTWRLLTCLAMSFRINAAPPFPLL